MTEREEDKQPGRDRQFWSVWRGWVLLALFAVGIVVVLAVLGWLGVIDTGLGQYIPDPGITPAPQPERAKTLWDWMDLLLVPMALALGAAFFTWVTNRREREAEEKRAQATLRAEDQRTNTEREIASNRAQDIALQAYLDRMDALLREGLLDSQPGDVPRAIARARSLAVLRQLDGERKALLLHFLHGLGLVTKIEAADGRPTDSIVDLRYADLRGVELEWTYLPGTMLERANLEGANLSGTVLHDSNLLKARLRGANLHQTILSDADLRAADITDEQLDQAASLKGAILPDGSRHE